MAEFNVTASQLNAKAEELQQLNATFKTKVNALEETEASLASMWEGEAQAAFRSAFNRDKTNMNNFYNAIAQYVAVLQEIASRYAQTEAQNVQTASKRSY